MADPCLRMSHFRETLSLRTLKLGNRTSLLWRIQGAGLSIQREPILPHIQKLFECCGYLAAKSSHAVLLKYWVFFFPLEFQ